MKTTSRDGSFKEIRRGFFCLLLAAACWGTAACGGGNREKQDSDSEPQFNPSLFTVRGRLPRTTLRWCYEVKSSRSPSRAALKKAIDVTLVLTRALDLWAEVGPFRFQQIDTEDEADLVFRFSDFGPGDGDHGCWAERGVELARTSAMKLPATIEFDGRANWGTQAGGSQGLSLYAVALHEIGHVLGLDHTPDEQSLMYPGYGEHRTKISASDRDGIRSLYGDGSAVAGDLVVELEDGPRLLLAGVLRDPLTRWTVLDLEHDGRDEIAVWHPKASPSSWILYRFDEQWRPVASVGPRLVPWSADDDIVVDRLTTGESVVLKLGMGGRYAAVVFDGSSLDGRSWGTGVSLSTARGFRDEDGDGVFERLPEAVEGKVIKTNRAADLIGAGGHDHGPTIHRILTLSIPGTGHRLDRK